MGLTLNRGYVGGSGSYPTLEVTITNGTATGVTATLGSKVVNLTYDSAAGVWRGTLKAFGTWTITATDGEKTASDLVAISGPGIWSAEITLSRLPSGYTELEYIGLTGAQYFNSEIPSANYIYETKFLYSNDVVSGWGNTYPAIIGSAFSPNGNNGCGIEIDVKNARMSMMHNTNNWDTSDNSFLKNVTYAVVADAISLTIKINDEAVEIESVGANTFPTANMYFGVLNYNNTPGDSTFASWAKFKGKIYYLYLKTQSGYIAKFIPAKRNSDNAVGMYDITRNTFYTSATSTAFTAGPEV